MQGKAKSALCVHLHSTSRSQLPITSLIRKRHLRISVHAEERLPLRMVPCFSRLYHRALGLCLCYLMPLTRDMEAYTIQVTACACAATAFSQVWNTD